MRRSLLGNAFEDYRAPDEGAFSRCHIAPNLLTRIIHLGLVTALKEPFRGKGLLRPGAGVEWRISLDADGSRSFTVSQDPVTTSEWTTDPQTAEKVALDGKRNAAPASGVLPTLPWRGGRRHADPASPER